jgi:hypothetical protein
MEPIQGREFADRFAVIWQEDDQLTDDELLERIDAMIILFADFGVGLPNDSVITPDEAEDGSLRGLRFPNAESAFQYLLDGGLVGLGKVVRLGPNEYDVSIPGTP